MNNARYSCCGLRLPPGVVLVVLSALLLSSQIAAAAHAEVDCEHDSCGLCIASANEAAPVGDPPSRATSLCKRFVESSLPDDVNSASALATQFIRGPPAT